jgi:Arc/MetJ-type ribon-helix-helix transcriptional regulator
MTIALAKDVEDFLREQVQAGVAADPSELANDVLRCVRDQQRKPFEITPQLEAWLLEAADQPATPLTKADFDGIRQRARKRTLASGACVSARRTISLPMLSASSIGS